MGNKGFNFGIVVAVVAIALIGIRTLLIGGVSEAQGPVTVRLSGWSGSPVEIAALRRLVNEFEAQNPDIRVRYEAIADQYMDVIKTRLIGEAAPDVFYLDVSDAPFLIGHQVLEPLDAYITPEFDLDDFEPNLLNAFRAQTHLYGVPKDYSTLALFYNRAAFAEAGFSEPPRTWDDLRQYAKRLTVDRDGNGRIDQYGFGEVPELPRQAYRIRAFGGQLTDSAGYAAIASDAAIQGLQPVVDQYRQDRTSAQPSDVGTTSAEELFAQGRAAMIITGNWAIAYLQETFPDLDYGVAEVPLIHNQPGTMVFTVAYVMNRQSAHKPEAWRLIAYLTGKTGMKAWTESSLTLPTRQSVAAALGYEQDDRRAPFVAGIDYATPWQAGEHLPIIITHFNNQFLSAMLGEQPLPQAMLRAQTSANREIQANQ